MRYLIGLAVAAAGWAPSPGLAQTFTAPAEIDAAVARFLGAAVGAPGGAARPVDPRLKLAACDQDLQVAWHGRAGSSLQVSCPMRGWRVFVAARGQGATGRAQLGSEIVQRGETVSILFEGLGFVLSRQGEAMEAGAEGQWIRIRPTGDKAQPIRGQVVGPAMVRVAGAS